MAKLDLQTAAEFLKQIPEGCWTTYGDVAVAAGGTVREGRAVAAWIVGRGHELSYEYRVLNKRGEINTAWKPTGPHHPANATEVRARLESEGVRFPAGRADPKQRWPNAQP